MKATCNALGFATALGLMACGNPSLDESQSSVSALHPKKTLEAVNLWRVTAHGGLNCRTDAGTQHPIVFDSLPAGTLMDAVGTEYPGVHETKLDSYGRLWVRVVPRSPVEHTPCYVLGEDRYIQPYVTKVGSLKNLEGDLSCQVEVPYSETLAYLETSAHRIYLCRSGEQVTYLSYNKGSTSYGPALKLVSSYGDSISLQPSFGAFFHNGEFHYSIFGPATAQYPVANLFVTQDGLEFPTILNTPAEKFYY